MVTQSDPTLNKFKYSPNALFNSGAGIAPQIVSYGGMIGRVIETDANANMVKVDFGRFQLWLTISQVEAK